MSTDRPARSAGARVALGALALAFFGLGALDFYLLRNRNLIGLLLLLVVGLPALLVTRQLQRKGRL